MEWNNFKKQDAGCDKYGKQRLELAVYLRDNILYKYNNYFIENGTLLGAYRNGKFIAHDDDFDFTFLLNSLEEINDFYNYINENLDKKYKCRILNTYANKLEIYNPDYGSYELLGPQYNNNDYHYVTIDIQFYIKKGNYYHCLYDGKTDEDKIEHDIIFPLKKIMLEGEYFNCPNDTEKFLVINYGSIKEGAKYNKITKKYE